jgi:CHAT domain-containing protein
VEVLAQEEFTQMKLIEQLQRSKFNLVHLATHGRFSSNEDDTFILTGDEEPENARMNINQLQKLLEVKGPSRAIELLVLSACNTAAGDAKAVLGLAGVAVRAGARSTIATLWGANDLATAELMGNQFYPRLKTPGSKAQALRDSQLALLNDPQYNHPYYWAPFILVGNWL